MWISKRMFTVTLCACGLSGFLISCLPNYWSFLGLIPALVDLLIVVIIDLRKKDKEDE